MEAPRFRCPCCGKAPMDETLLKKVNDLETCLGRALRVTSGYRCETHNHAVGGAKHSYHLEGRAVDFWTPDKEEQKRIIALAETIGFGGIGVGQTFLHLDVGPDRPHWKY